MYLGCVSELPAHRLRVHVHGRPGHLQAGRDGDVAGGQGVPALVNSLKKMTI
jgi:hypothetical protein